MPNPEDLFRTTNGREFANPAIRGSIYLARRRTNKSICRRLQSSEALHSGSKFDHNV